MKTFKYRWKINNKEITGMKDCQDQEALRLHIHQHGGELVEIISETDKPAPAKQDALPQHAANHTREGAGDQNSTQMLYPLGHINAATVFFGPLAGFYLVGKNFKRMHHDEAARKNSIIGWIFLIFLFGAFTLKPAGSVWDWVFLALIAIYTICLFIYFKKIQGPELDTHFKQGAKKYSQWRSVGVGLVALAITLAISLACSSAVLLVRVINAHRFADQAVQFGKIGSYKEAVAKFNTALILTPYDARLYYNRGLAFLNSGFFVEAIGDFTKCLELEPRNALAYKNRALAHDNIGEYDEVIADCTKSIALDPNDSEVFAARAFVYQYNRSHAEAQWDQDYEKALSDWTRVIEINPSDAPGNASAYYNRGLLNNIRKNYDQAIADFTKRLEWSPPDINVYRFRAVAFAGKEDYDRAIIDVSRVIDFAPGEPLAYVFRAYADSKKGALDQALADYTKAIALAPDIAAIYNDRAVVYFKKAEYDKAWADVHKVESLKGFVDPVFLDELTKASGRDK